MLPARPPSLALAALVAFASPAVAQEVYYDEDMGEMLLVEEAPVFLDRLPPVPPRELRYAPRVYGWGAQVYVPAPVRRSCGTFRYWNGERCADARFEPPAR